MSFIKPAAICSTLVVIALVSCNKFQQPSATPATAQPAKPHQATKCQADNCKCGDKYCPIGAICSDGVCSCGDFNLSNLSQEDQNALINYTCMDDLLLRCGGADIYAERDCMCNGSQIHSGFGEHSFCLNGQPLKVYADSFTIHRDTERRDIIHVNADNAGSCGGSKESYDLCINLDGCYTKTGAHILFGDRNDPEHGHIDAGYLSQSPWPNQEGGYAVCVIKRDNALPMSVAGSAPNHFVCDQNTCACGSSMCKLGELCKDGSCQPIQGCGLNELINTTNRDPFYISEDDDCTMYCVKDNQFSVIPSSDGPWSCGKDGKWRCDNRYSTDLDCPCGDQICGSGQTCENGKCVCGTESVQNGYECKVFPVDDKTLYIAQECIAKECTCGSYKLTTGEHCRNNVPICNEKRITECQCDNKFAASGSKCFDRKVLCNSPDGCTCGNIQCRPNEECIDNTQCRLPGNVCAPKKHLSKKELDELSKAEDPLFLFYNVDTDDDRNFNEYSTCFQNMWCHDFENDSEDFPQLRGEKYECLCPDGQSFVNNFEGKMQPCPAQPANPKSCDSTIRFVGDHNFFKHNAYRCTCGTDFVPQNINQYVCVAHGEQDCSPCTDDCRQYPGFDGWQCSDNAGCACGDKSCESGSYCTHQNDTYLCVKPNPKEDAREDGNTGSNQQR